MKYLLKIQIRIPNIGCLKGGEQMVRLRLNWELILIEMRKQKITQRILARKLELDESRISYIMRNPEIVGLRTIEKLANALGIKPISLIVEEEVIS